MVNRPGLNFRRREAVCHHHMPAGHALRMHALMAFRKDRESLTIVGRDDSDLHDGRYCLGLPQPGECTTRRGKSMVHREPWNCLQILGLRRRTALNAREGLPEECQHYFKRACRVSRDTVSRSLGTVRCLRAGVRSIRRTVRLAAEESAMVRIARGF